MGTIRPGDGGRSLGFESVIVVLLLLQSGIWYIAHVRGGRPTSRVLSIVSSTGRRMDTGGETVLMRPLGGTEAGAVLRLGAGRGARGHPDHHLGRPVLQLLGVPAGDGGRAQLVTRRVGGRALGGDVAGRA